MVPSRHEQIAGGSTMLSGDGQWTSFTIHPPNYPRFVEWAERDIGPTVLTEPGVELIPSTCRSTAGS